MTAGGLRQRVFLLENNPKLEAYSNLTQALEAMLSRQNDRFVQLAQTVARFGATSETSGESALHDALAKTARALDQLNSRRREQSPGPPVELVLLLSGQETCQRSPGLQQARELLADRCSRDQWQILVLAVGAQAVEQALDLGISPERIVAVRPDARDVKRGMRWLEEALISLGTTGVLPDGWNRSVGGLRILRGDITHYTGEAIVNAANNALSGGGGVDGAIHQAAGPELLVYTSKLGGCPTGEARVSPGFHLPADWIIHTVGPVWQGGESAEPELLASCYRSCVARAVENGLSTLAFPSISTGVYGYPTDQAAAIALREIHRALAEQERLTEITVVCFNEAIYQTYLALENGAELTQNE